MTTAVMQEAFDPKEIRYIKLGPGGAWERASIERGELQFGYAKVSHEPCLEGDWEQVARHLRALEVTAVANACREIRDFYTLGADCLWITLADGHLWWTFAEPEVHWLGSAGREHGVRLRRTIGGWRNTDLAGRPLRKDQLSTRLTKIEAYRGTICRIEDADYLKRRIQGIEEPLATRAREARAAMT
jgi:hypothetical protein